MARKKKPTIKDEQRQWRICSGCGQQEVDNGHGAFVCPDPSKDNRDTIPLDKLEHGAYYFGGSRNATVARWNAKLTKYFKEGEFSFLNSQFDSVWVDHTWYGYGTRGGFNPHGKMDSPPFEITLRTEEKS